MLVYGRNVAREILNSNTKVYKVFLDNNFRDEELMDKIDKKGLKKFHIDKNKIDKMCGSSTNQGIALDIEEYGYFPIYIEKGIGDEFDVYPFTDNNVCKQIAYIKYVHQLQHLLFGLGLKSEMEV